MRRCRSVHQRRAALLRRADALPPTRRASANIYPYVEGKTQQLFPFGHGLSYTSFDLSAPRLSADRITPDGKVQVEVDVANTGSRDGDEVVQIYIRDEQSSVPRPVEELKGFRRVTLKKVERTTVRFEPGRTNWASGTWT